MPPQHHPHLLLPGHGVGVGDHDPGIIDQGLTGAGVDGYVTAATLEGLALGVAPLDPSNGVLDLGRRSVDRGHGQGDAEQLLGRQLGRISGKHERGKGGRVPSLRLPWLVGRGGAVLGRGDRGRDGDGLCFGHDSGLPGQVLVAGLQKQVLKNS